MLRAGAAGHSTPLSFPEALAARDRPHAALLVLRASEHASSAAQSNDPFHNYRSSMPEPGSSAAETEQPAGTPGLLAGEHP